MDPIEIRVTGTDDSGKALASAEKGLKGVGDAAKATERPLKGAADGLDDVSAAAKDIGRQMQSFDAEVEKAGASLRELGNDASKAESKLDGAGDSVRRIDKFIGQGGRSVEEYGTGIGGVGDRFDELDTRAMGAADGFAGLTDAMKWNKLTAQEQAMVFSDLGSSMYNFIIPQVQSLGKGLSNLTEKMGGVKNMAIGAAGVAGVAALTAGLVALDQQAKEETSKSLDDLSLKLQGVNYASTPATEGLIQVMASVGKLDELWERAKMAGDEQALQFLELAENAGISKEQIAEYRSELDTKKAAEEAGVSATQRMTEAMKAEGDAIRGVSDARRAAVDPLFAMLDAMTGNRDAQREVNEAFVAYGDAVREHGEGSAEAASALRDLNSAQDDAVMSAADLESATSDLEAQIAEHPATLGNAINSLERWKAQGSITADQAARMETRFRNAAREANRIDGTSTRTLNARDNASGKIVNVGNRLSELDGRSATVYVNANTIIRKITEGFGFNAAGGPPAAFSTAASGGARGANVLVGEHGPELVNLPYGSMVKSNSDTERLLSDSGGGAATITWAGGPSDDLGMAVWKWLQQRVQVSYGGDVQRALGG